MCTIRHIKTCILRQIHLNYSPEISEASCWGGVGYGGEWGGSMEWGCGVAVGVGVGGWWWWWVVGWGGGAGEGALSLTWIYFSYYIHHTVSDERFEPFKFGNGSVISSDTLLGMWLLFNSGV